MRKLSRTRKKKLTVSVIIPCYNVEKYLEKNLEGVLKQTRKPDEIIAIDDCSTDGTRNFLKKYKQLKIIAHRKNKGLAQVRNTAIKYAKGEILVFFDADVVPESDLIEKILEEYTSGEIAGVGGQAIEANIKSIFDQWRKLYCEPSRGNKKINDVEYISGLCSSYRKKVLKEVGGFNPIFRTNAEDFEMGFKIHEAGYRLVYTPKAKVYHQKTDNFRSLLKTGFNYTYWGKIAHSLHQGPLVSRAPSSIFGAISKRVAADLFKHKSLRLAALSILMFLMEIKAQMYFMRDKKKV
jgi:glycosyltransferase involved in cell wall biosynthesis